MALGAAFSEPSTRAITVITPALIRSAEIRADSGDLTLAADLCEWLFGDDRFSACMRTRLDAFVGVPVEFEKGKGKSARAAVRAVEADEDWWTLFPESEQRRLLQWGYTLGAAVGQLDYSARPELGAREVPTFRVWSSRWLRKDTLSGKWFVRVAEGGTTREVEASRENGFRLFLPYGTGRPWVYGLWRGNVRFALLKSFAIDDLGAYSNMHGHPAWVVTPSANVPSNPSHRSELASDLSQLGAQSVIVLPQGFELDLVEATAKTWQVFDYQIKLANDSFAIGWLGGNLVTDVQGNAGTGATAQTLVRLELRRWDNQVFSSFAHGELLTDWAGRNFGDTSAAPWPMRDVEPPADATADAAALGGLGDAISKMDAALVANARARGAIVVRVIDAEALVEGYGYTLSAPVPVAAPPPPPALPPAPPAPPGAA